MTRREAYLGALKFQFQGALLQGAGRRYAWRVAKFLAATYAFNVRSDELDRISLTVL